MLRINRVQVSNLKEAVIDSGNAMRLKPVEYTEEEFQKGLERCKRLTKVAIDTKNSAHSNYLTGINVYFDLYYPNYWTAEFQRYHFVDIVTSSSKMHRLLKMNIDEACNKYVSNEVIDQLQKDIDLYNELKNLEVEEHRFLLRDGSEILTRDKQETLYVAWMKCISDCPLGIELFMAVRTNYKQLQNIWLQRHNHKLKEDWGAFCKMIEELPYANELIFGK